MEGREKKNWSRVVDLLHKDVLRGDLLETMNWYMVALIPNGLRWFMANRNCGGADEIYCRHYYWYTEKLTTLQNYFHEF